MTPPEGRVLILMAHGSRHPAPPQEVAGLAAELQRSRPDVTVRHAFLDMLTPTLPEVIAEAVAGGAERIEVLPLLLNTGYHVTRDIPAMIVQARRQYPQVRFTLLRHLGAHPGYAALVQDMVAAPEQHRTETI